MGETARLLLELGLLLACLGLLGVLAGRFGISAIPLYLLVGLSFGEGGFTPLASISGFLEVGSNIGVVLLLFTLGLQYTPHELFTTMRSSWPVALLNVVLNVTPGVVLALLLGWGAIGAFVLGGVTFVTSSGIAAKVISDLGWTGNRETPTVLSLSVSEDVVMAVYLPILTTLLAGLAWSQAAWGLSLALLAIAGALLVATRYGDLLGRLLASPSDEILLLKVLGLVLVVAGLAEQVYVSAAVGAFFVGMALSGEVTRTVRRVIEPLTNLFAAVFFVYFGLQTNPIDLPPVLLLALGLAAVGIVTKFITGWWAAARTGLHFSGRLRAGFLMTPRGEFSVVIAGLGVNAGADQQLVSLAAAYVLILAMVGPLLARLADPIARRRRRRIIRRRKDAASGEEEAV
jgi:monovalent cation:H+ antiporter-2, CPA2 family